ncbi:hypothetical protein [Flavobacterium microcysteis]|uniref:Uncharacterized protein n=1 Tax=Flavobacterium microcysteis TaxID=2596891 RepID=A0A501Q6G4_9FLAO|nr:hypothetical protein [Flavobacterium microcysteis]TPD68519.1 hypothetical protein FJA49_10680 [Flavobacterium microcysteis]
MKNLLFSLMAITLFSLSANASEIKENTIATAAIDKIENTTDLGDLTQPTATTSIKITWGRKSKGCRGFGICRIIITIDIQFKASVNSRGNLVLEANAAGLESVRSHFGSNTITVEEDYPLEADVARQLGLQGDYTVRAGRYTLQPDGNGNFVTTM